MSNKRPITAISTQQKHQKLNNNKAIQELNYLQNIQRIETLRILKIFVKIKQKLT